MLSFSAALGEGLHIDTMHAYDQVTAADFTGKKEIIFLDRKTLEDGQLEISFEFRKQRFHYISEKDLFEKLAYPVQVRDYFRTVTLPLLHVILWRAILE